MIYATSDLHYGVSPVGDAAVRSLAKELGGAKKDDVLLIGGDIAIDDAGIEECLALFHSFPGRKLAIAGNHDVWVESGADSLERYRRLPDLFMRSGFHPLEDEPVVINGVGFVGSMGWYDYSFKDDIGIPEDAYRAKLFPEGHGVMWGDAAHVRWRYLDEDLTQLLAERLEGHLTRLRHVRDVVVLMHHVPTKALLFHPRCLVPREWRFLNAFLGSNRYAGVIARHPNVRQVICGHIHRAKTVRLRGQAYTSIGSDYDAKALLAYNGTRISSRTIPAPRLIDVTP